MIKWNSQQWETVLRHGIELHRPKTEGCVKEVTIATLAKDGQEALPKELRRVHQTVYVPEVVKALLPVLGASPVGDTKVDIPYQATRPPKPGPVSGASQAPEKKPEAEVFVTATCSKCSNVIPFPAASAGDDTAMAPCCCSGWAQVRHKLRTWVPKREPEPPKPETVKASEPAAQAAPLGGLAEEFYLVLTEIRDAIRALPKPELGSATDAASPEPVVVHRTTHPSPVRPRILVLGTMPDQFDRLVKRWDDKAELVYSKQFEKNPAAGNLPQRLDAVILNTKFTRHDKDDILKKSGIPFHRVYGGVSTVDAEVASIVNNGPKPA